MDQAWGCAQEWGGRGPDHGGDDDFDGARSGRGRESDAGAAMKQFRYILTRQGEQGMTKSIMRTAIEARREEYQRRGIMENLRALQGHDRAAIRKVTDELVPEGTILKRRTWKRSSMKEYLKWLQRKQNKLT